MPFAILRFPVRWKFPDAENGTLLTKMDSPFAGKKGDCERLCSFVNSSSSFFDPNGGQQWGFRADLYAEPIIDGRLRIIRAGRD